MIETISHTIQPDLPPPPPGQNGWPWTEPHHHTPDTLPNGQAWPKVTIVTPSLNQGQFIEATIRSVLLQGYPNLEYMIIDGGSSDGTLDIIRKYEPWLTYWVSERDRGQAHAINKGFARANGEIFSWLNSDDYLLPNALYHVAEERQQKTGAVAWIGRCYRIDSDGRIQSVVIPRGLNRDSLADWYRQGFFYQPSCFFAAQAWDQVGSLDESLNMAFDLDLWLRLSAVGEFAAIPEIISAAFIHEIAKTTAQPAEMHAETMMVQIKYGYQEIAINHLKYLLEKQSVKFQFKRMIKNALSGFTLRYILGNKSKITHENPLFCGWRY